MNDMNNITNWTAAQISARFAVGGVVLPANNGPIYAAKTRNLLTGSGFTRIQGCH